MVISPVHYIAFPLLAAFSIPLISKLYKEAARVIPGIILFYNMVISYVLMQRVA